MEKKYQKADKALSKALEIDCDDKIYGKNCSLFTPL